MTDSDNYTAAIATAVREYLTEVIQHADDTPPEMPATATYREAGWHPFAQADISPTRVPPGYQAWRTLRLIDVLAAGDLLLVVFTERREQAEVYVHSEDVNDYRNLQMDADQAARSILTHLDKRLGGTGWQQATRSQRIGRLVILT
jgi:hypothetical protein